MSPKKTQIGMTWFIRRERRFPPKNTIMRIAHKQSVAINKIQASNKNSCLFENEFVV